MSCVGFHFRGLLILLFLYYYVCGDSSINSHFIVWTEEAGHQKLAANLICRELREADEPNLLDEEGDLFISFSIPLFISLDSFFNAFELGF